MVQSGGRLSSVLAILILVAEAACRLTPGLRAMNIRDAGSSMVATAESLPGATDLSACLSGCECEFRKAKLFAMKCKDNEELIKNEPDMKPEAFWNQLKEVHLEGRRSYASVAKSAFLHGSKTIENLVIKSAANFDLTDVKSLSSLRSLSLIGLGIDESSDLSQLAGLTNLSRLDLSRNAFRVFNAASLFHWAGTLVDFTLSRCDRLESVVFDDGQLVGSSGRTRLAVLRSIKLSGNPKFRIVCPWFVRSAPNVQLLDMSRNPKLAIVPSAFYSNSLASFSLESSGFVCDCRAAEVPFLHGRRDYDILEEPCADPINSSAVSSLADYVKEPANCRGGTVERGSGMAAWEEDERLAFAKGPLIMDCGDGLPSETEFVSWITPINEVKVRMITPSASSAVERCRARNDILEEACVPGDKHLILSRVAYTSGGSKHSAVLSNGSLAIWDFGWRDRGVYRCFTWSTNASRLLISGRRGEAEPEGAFKVLSSYSVRVKLDVVYRQTLYSLSLMYGFATAGGFLLVALLAKLVYFLLHNYGCCLFCCCCKDQLPPKAKQLKSALDSIEAYRTQQQEKLRENYNQQSDWIRQNCAAQMERVRENYNTQIQNLRDIRQYGSSQLSGIRDQYYEQMQRIRDYSTGQLERVHENYIFQRQKLRKFSAQNFIKMRETRKYTRKTMNKVIGTLPTLYKDLSACRQGLGRRQVSLEWEKEYMDSPDTVDVASACVAASGGACVSSVGGLRQSKSACTVDKEAMLPHVRRTGSEMSFRTASVARSRFPEAREGVEDPYGAAYYHFTTSSSEGRAKGRFPAIPLLRSGTKVRSFSVHFLPSQWFNGQQSRSMAKLDEPGGVHRVVIEHEPAGENLAADEVTEAGESTSLMRDFNSGNRPDGYAARDGSEKDQELAACLLASSPRYSPESVKLATPRGKDCAKSCAASDGGACKSEVDLTAMNMPPPEYPFHGLKRKSL